MKCRLADADAYLNDPRHVVAFQNWFQLRWADPNDEPPVTTRFALFRALTISTNIQVT